MNTRQLPNHDWELSPTDAITLQKQLAREIIVNDDHLKAVNFIAGTDIGFEKNGQTTRAVVTVLAAPSMELIEYTVCKIPTTMPYIPGLLSFRECPGLLTAFTQLSIKPDLILCDGQGIAHPRRLGIASHLGLLLDLPSIGVAKKRLFGQHDEVGIEQGAEQPLLADDQTIGTVVRTKSKTNPLYISPGHKVSVETGTQWVLKSLKGYKLPEPIRWADAIASERPSYKNRLAEIESKRV